MASVDDKIVAMSFENSKFESGVKTTISSIDKLKSSLQFTGVGKGLDGISNSINRTNFRPLSAKVDSVRAHFSALNVIAGAALGHLTIQAVNAGERIAKALTIGPILQGLDIYQTKLQAIQTILANTQAAGTKMSDVTKALQELNVYSNKTIYSFGEMTRNIGTFTAAGVALKPAVASIKGIANLAALSGSNSQQASTAMYQLSQAISAGQVHLQDWNSVVNAGLGGAVFQRALATTAQAMGKLKDGTVKLVGPMKNVQIAGESFRQSLSKPGGGPSWLTSDVLTKTLATFTGDMTDAQLAATGFNKEQIKQIQKTAQTAENAATQVKTFSQLMDVSKETIATGWARSFEIVIGNLNEAKKLFTDISNAIGNFATKSANARNAILQSWKDLGGRTLLLDSLKRAFHDLALVLKPIKEAFRDIFPRKTGQDLFNMTKKFSDLTKAMTPSKKTIEEIHRTFAGVFAILDIGKQILSGIIGVFVDLFKEIFKGRGSFLGITAGLGDFLVSIDLALKKGHGLETFFKGLEKVLIVPVRLIENIGHAIAHMFDGFSPKPFSKGMNISIKASEPFKKALEFITNALQGLGPAISKAVQNMNFELILSTIRTGLFAALVLLIGKFIRGTTLEKSLGLFGNKLGFGLAKGLGGGILPNLSKSFGALTGTLKSMQHNLQAKTLEAIAIAIALLTASIVALTLVKPKRLSGALTAIAIGFGELIGVMVVMNKLLDAKATVKLPVIAASLNLMATAIDILAIAVFTLSKLKASELAKGLGAVATLLGTLAVSSKLLAKNSLGLVAAGFALNEIAVALNVLVLAVKQFGSMDLISLGKGLGAIAIALTSIGLAMKLMPKTIPLTGAGLVIVAVALNILARAVAQFGKMDMKTIGKGLLGIGGALVIIAAAMKLMPKSTFIVADGLFIVALALGKIADAVNKMGGQSIRVLAKGLISLGVALGILAVALHAMAGTLTGAAALAIAAVGISLLASALVKLGGQSWTSIIKSMVALATGLGLIALAGQAVTPAIPALIGFGVALIAIGAGLALAGAGVALIGVGLSAIAVSGTTAVAILIRALIDLSKSLGEIGTNTILSLLEIVKAFAKVAPQFVKATLEIITMIAKTIIKAAKPIAEAIAAVVVQGLKALDEHGPDIIKAGFHILEELLKGIADNISKVVTMAATIIVNFADSLAKNANRLVSAGFDLLLSFITGITDNINKVGSVGADIIVKFIKGIGSDAQKVIDAGGNAITHFLIGLGKNLNRMVVAGGQAIAQFVKGLGTAGSAIITAATNTIIQLLNALSSNNTRLVNAGFKAIVRYLNGIADAIDKHEPDLIKAGFRIGVAIVHGMIKGLESEAASLAQKAKDVGKSIYDHIRHPLGIRSPSRETFKLGKYVVQGLINGIDQTTPKANDAANRLSKSLLATMNNISFDDLLHTEPTIKPVLDLSNIQNGSKKLQGIINKSPLGTVSLDHASVISMGQASPSAGISTPDTSGQVIKFEQNNYSPRALSSVDIYRRTRNQLSQLKAKTK